MKNLKVLGVSAGNGVVLHPFKDSLIGNIETRSIFYTPGNIQWKLNFGDIPFWRDLPKKLKGTTVDIIIGHPDCGHSSQLAYSRAKKLSNPRVNKSLNLFIECVLLFKPKVFLMENLTKMLAQISKEEFEATFSDYYLTFYNGSVTAFGNSQVNRKRMIMVGTLKSLGTEAKKAFKPPKKKKFLFTTQELIGDLAYITKESQKIKIGHVTEPLDETITLYGGFKAKISDIQKGWNNQNAGKSRWEVKDRKYTRAPGVYRNLPNEYPNTVRKGNREFNPQGIMMSPRERARIQGIPDDFQIWVDETKIKSCINKGRVTVTKCFPYEVSEWFYYRVLKFSELNTR